MPYVLSLKPHKGRWAEAEAAHTPEEAAQSLEWNGPEDPAEWKAILRRFRDGHEERWWAAEVTTLIGYGPKESVRLVVVSTDPATLPANSSWYLTTNLPVPGSSREEESPPAAASVEEVLRLYGLRM